MPCWRCIDLCSAGGAGSEGEALSWYADEVLVCEGDLIGKTEAELRSLHFRRDRDWLQS